MYCTTRKELAAVIYALKKFRHYVLDGKLFLLRTDHGALTSLFKVPVPIQQQARYLSFLADYNFEIQHRAGSQHGNSDGLSRRPCGSKKCTRDDCEIGYRQTDENHRTDKSGTATAGTLRSGKPYLKNGPTRRNQQETSNLQPSSSETNDQGTDFGTLDIPWETIRQAQETDVTLKKIVGTFDRPGTSKQCE